MKVKSLNELHGKGAVLDDGGNPLSILKREAAPIAQQLGVAPEKLVEVINSNSKALLLIVEALASQQPPPQVTVNLPPVKRWVINVTQRDDGERISQLEIVAG